MRDQHFFAEALLSASGDDFCGNACEVAIAFAVFGAESQRHQCRAARLECDAELLGDVIAKRGRPHLGDRESASGDYQRWSGKLRILRGYCEAKIVSDFLNMRVEEDFYACSGAFFFEQCDDLLRGAIAEELAKRLLVIGDLVFFNERDEILRGVASQCGFGEVGIGGEKILRRAVEVRKIATATTGDENLFADAVSVIENSNALAAFRGFDGAHQASGTSSENDCVKFVGCSIGHWMEIDTVLLSLLCATEH